MWDNILQLGQQHIDQQVQGGECEAGEALFAALARHYAPSSKRGSKSAHEASRRVKSDVVQMDGMSSEQGKLVMVLAATNIH